MFLLVHYLSSALVKAVKTRIVTITLQVLFKMIILDLPPTSIWTPENELTEGLFIEPVYLIWLSIMSPTFHYAPVMNFLGTLVANDVLTISAFNRLHN